MEAALSSKIGKNTMLRFHACKIQYMQPDEQNKLGKLINVLDLCQPGFLGKFVYISCFQDLVWSIEPRFVVNPWNNQIYPHKNDWGVG